MPGPLPTGRVILGEDAGTSPLPDGLLAAVYYPRHERDHRVPPPNPLHVSKGPFPVLLYAHAYRGNDVGSHPASRDFTSVEVVLAEVASHGCVCVAPDLSRIPFQTPQEERLVNLRGAVLAICYASLDSLNATLFAGQLDLKRVVVAGHSHGASGATRAGRIISGFSHPKALAYGLIAPEFGGETGPDTHPLLVLGGGLDDAQSANPLLAYAAGGKPKTLVMIPGANHFGYTDICPSDNTCATLGLVDENGTISRDDQQQTAAGYLAAFVRYFVLGDEAVRPLLTGERIIDGLESFGLQIQSSGFRFGPLGPPVSSILEPH